MGALRELSGSSSQLRVLIDMLPAANIKFADEKHLKGQEIFNKNGRRCPVTGDLEPVIVDPDFRNSHTIIGCCGCPAPVKSTADRRAFI
jgi:hypothetical protein